MDGGALYRRKPTITDKIAEGAAMFVNPTASWSSAFKLLGTQGLKGITDNVKYYRGGAGIIDKALKSGIAGSPWQVDYKKGLELLKDPTLFKDKKMVKALDSAPYNERQWGHWLARNMINTKQKLGLGVKKPKNVKSRRVRKTGKKN